MQFYSDSTQQFLMTANTASPIHQLKAPYAQPVLDASKLSSKKSSIDERIAAVRERRLQQQQLQGNSWLKMLNSL